MRFLIFTSLITICSLASNAQAENSAEDWSNWSSLEDWEISGSNTVRAESIKNNGSLLSSPYPLDGEHTYNEFDVNFSRNLSPFSRVNGQFFGVVNASDYRHPDEGFVPERMNVNFQSGETAIPLRLEIGDYFSNISYRTLQRSLKGAQIELQPETELFGADHSIMLFSGANQSFWNHFDFDDDRYEGASWLMSGGFGSLAVNSIRNTFDSLTNTTSTVTQKQWVNSIAYATPLEISGEKLNIEAEVAHFSGDYGVTPASSGQEDKGMFTEISGRSDNIKQLDYRVRYENYGEDYQPRGGLITPNRKSTEAFAGWQFDNGVYFQGRTQRFQDAAHTGNRLVTDVLGGRLTGNFFGDLAPDVNGSFHAYHQDMGNDNNSISLKVITLDTSLTKPIDEDLTAEVRAFYQRQDDLVASNNDIDTYQLGFVVNHNFDLTGGITGNIAPGITLRNIDSNGFSSVEAHPLVDFSLYKDSHSFTASYGFFNQNRIVKSTTTNDIATQTVSVNYNYNWDIHEVGLEASWFDRDIEQFLDTQTSRIGVYWTVDFYKPAGSSTVEGSNPYYPSATGQIEPPSLLATNILGGASSTLVSALNYGESVSSQLNNSKLDKYGTSRRTGRATIYNTAFIKEITQRQRLAIIADGDGKLDKIVVAMDADSTGRPEQIGQTFARIRDTLIKRYGTPSNVYDKGDFTANFSADIQASRLVRIVEWDKGDTTLRFGIPRRTDGLIRFELQEAESFPSARNSNWGANFR